MLASAGTVSVVAETLKRNKIGVLVVDPVMVATTGAQLLPENAIKTLLEELLPITTILTPNVPEAELLIEKSSSVRQPKTNTLDGLISLAKRVQQLGPKFVLLKGGHLPLSKDGTQIGDKVGETYIHNILSWEGSEPIVITSHFQESKNTHGTGCSLASEY
jgi:hydroxymethylpyrimidine kinase/phosphomethylpyrimidine kinase